MNGKEIKKALGIKTGVEGGANGLTEKIIIHDTPAIQLDVKLYVNYRIVKITAEYAKSQGLNTNKDWFAVQVQMESGWMFLAEPMKNERGAFGRDKKGQLIPVIQYFENEKWATEYMKEVDNQQKNNLKKLGIKNTSQKKRKDRL